MKRAIACILSLVILLSAIPFQALAAENCASKQDALFELACEVFPEYTSIIRKQVNTAEIAPFSDNANHIAFMETRKISDTESLSIAQMTNGAVVVLKNNTSIFSIDYPDSSFANSSHGVSGSATFEVACNYAGCGTFNLSNVKFAIEYSGNDYFTSYGTANPGSGVSVGSKTLSSTYMSYPITFKFSQTLSVTLELYFSNDQLVARIN